MKKCNINDNHYFITATFLDVRTKQFGRIPDTVKKQYYKIASSHIKKLNVVNNTRKAADNNNGSPNKKQRLHIFDYDKPLAAKQSTARSKLTGIDLEIYDYINQSVNKQDRIGQIIK